MADHDKTRESTDKGRSETTMSHIMSRWMDFFGDRSVLLGLLSVIIGGLLVVLGEILMGDSTMPDHLGRFYVQDGEIVGPVK